MAEEIIKIRNNKQFFSQPANNKILNLIHALECDELTITVISSALANKNGWFSTVYGEKISKSNIIYASVLGLPLINSVSSVMSIYRIIKKIHSKNKIDRIIFYNFKPEAAWPAFFANKLLGIPITVEFEDGYRQIKELSRLKKVIFSCTERFIINSVDKAIVANSIMKEQFNVPVHVLRGIVNPSFYNKCISYKKTVNDKFTIFYSGGLDRSRGIHVLLEAMKYVRVPCKVQITGKGNIEIADERVEYLGFLSYDKMLQAMMRSDLLVQCQLVNDDFASVSFPSKLFEYVATGNYIISSALPDVKDFAGDIFTYYENDDPRDLAYKIERVYYLWTAGQMNDYRVRTLCDKHLPESIMNSLIRFLFND